MMDIPAVVFATVKTGIILMTVVGNFLVCVAGLYDRRHLSGSSLLVVSLAAVDLTIGLTVMPLSAYFELSSPGLASPRECFGLVYTSTALCTLSIVHLFLISVDRYSTITNPLRNPLSLSKPAVAMVIVATWVCSIAVTSVPIGFGFASSRNNQSALMYSPIQCHLGYRGGGLYSLAYGLLVFFLPAIATLVMHTRIARIARHQVTLIRKHSVVSEIDFQDTSQRPPKPPSRNKAGRTLFLEAACLILRWGPYFTLFTFFPCFDIPIDTDIYQVFFWLGYSKSSSNPCLYAAPCQELRNAFKKMFACKGSFFPDNCLKPSSMVKSSPIVYV